MFQEWARNRYGVFPESGFAGDALYPEFYTDDDGDVSNNEDCDGLGDIDGRNIVNGTGAVSQLQA